MEDLEKGIDLPLVQRGVKGDLRKLKFCTGSKRGPGLRWVPGTWASMLGMVLAIIFKSDNLRGDLAVRVVFSPNGVKGRLLFSNVRIRVAAGC